VVLLSNVSCWFLQNIWWFDVVLVVAVCSLRD
jgi:hypothetical protein